MADERATRALHFAKALQAALLETQGESGSEAAGVRLKELATLTRGEAAPFFSSPVFSVEEKTAVLKEILRKKRVDSALMRFLELLVSLKSLDLLDDIARAYAEAEDERRNEAVATVSTAFPLAAAEQKRIVAGLSRATGKNVRLDVREDPGLIGGVVAQVGSVVYDASIQGWLRRLQEEF